MNVSERYRELTADQARQLAPQLETAWQNVDIPAKQNELVMKELQEQSRGELCAPYRALIEVWKLLPAGLTVLEIGASSCFNSVVLKNAGFEIDYVGMDFSQAYKQFADYFGIDFRVGDARAIPFKDAAFDLVLNGACMMHVYEYQKAFSECVRVARKYIVLHRTPIQRSQKTRFFVKEAYGVTCMEMHFSEFELTDLFEHHSLKLIRAIDVFQTDDGSYGHRDYLLEK
jgi:ubiquinone/menaquinone biosynthesis C-methylase UbiE